MAFMHNEYFLQVWMIAECAGYILTRRTLTLRIKLWLSRALEVFGLMMIRLAHWKWYFNRMKDDAPAEDDKINFQCKFAPGRVYYIARI